MKDLDVIRSYALALKRIADQRCEELAVAADEFATAYDAAEDARARAEAKRDETHAALDEAARFATYAAQAIGGDVGPENMKVAADAIRALCRDLPSTEAA